MYIFVQTTPVLAWHALVSHLSSDLSAVEPLIGSGFGFVSDTANSMPSTATEGWAWTDDNVSIGDEVVVDEDGYATLA